MYKRQAYHPAGGRSSSEWVHQEKWLDMNAMQSGHGSRDTPVWAWIQRDLSLKPLKPTLDMEPAYEDHPVNPWDGQWTRATRGYFSAYDVRARIYRGVLAGGCGVTYGHHSIWQFLDPARNPTINVGDTLIGWQQALGAEAAGQVQFLKKLMLSRPATGRRADSSLVAPGSHWQHYIQACRSTDGRYALIYLPENKSITINLKPVSGKEKNLYWFDPRTGRATFLQKTNAASLRLAPPPGGPDWVLVMDDASANFKPPGS